MMVLLIHAQLLLQVYLILKTPYSTVDHNTQMHNVQLVAIMKMHVQIVISFAHMHLIVFMMVMELMN